MKIFTIGSYFSEDNKEILENIDRAKKVGIEIIKKGSLAICATVNVCILGKCSGQKEYHEYMF